MFRPSTALQILLAVFLFPALSSAHELWIQPDPPFIESSSPANAAHEIAIRIFTGERFHGEELGWDPARCAELRDISAGSTQELKGEAGAAPAAYLTIEKPAVHLVEYRSNPATIEIEAKTFNTYLLEHGLREAWQTRQQRGELEKPGRERFTRYCKAVIALPGAPAGDRTAQEILGQRLEIVPLARQAGDRTLPFQILFENRPLAEAVVFAAPQDNPTPGLVRAISDAKGIVTFDLQEPGLWMISLVHMLPCSHCPDADWESCWASFVVSSPVSGFVP
jgi:uncharacterized GH25 family protein